MSRYIFYTFVWSASFLTFSKVSSQENNYKMSSKNRFTLDFKINVFYAYVGNNVHYDKPIQNVKKYYFVPGYFEPPDGGTGNFIKSEQYQGLVKYEQYTPYEAELILRRSFFKGRFDIGLKTSYKYQKLAFGYYINSPNPKHTLNLFNINENLHYITHGIQLGYNFIKPNISIRLGLDNNWSNQKDYFGLVYEDDSIHFSTVQWYPGGLIGNFTWNFDVYRYINKNLFFGISSRFYLPFILSNGNFREDHIVEDKKTGERLFTGQVINLELYLGVHLGYTLPIFSKKTSATTLVLPNDISPQNELLEKVEKKSSKPKKSKKN